jgi:hypothetical protein
MNFLVFMGISSHLFLTTTIMIPTSILFPLLFC